MKNLSTIICILCWASLGQANFSQASVKVVANIEDDIQLSKQQVRYLFLGVQLEELIAVQLPPANDTRVRFNTKVIGLTEARIQSYWAQMRFSGRRKPPQQFAEQELAIDYVLNNKRAVVYLPIEAPVPEGLKVIYEVKD